MAWDKHWPAGHEKAADGPYYVFSSGARVESRYGKQAEIRDMLRMLTWVRRATPKIGATITSIWCDSKACACYMVTCQRPDLFGEDVGYWLDKAAVAVGGGGHNGIMVEGGPEIDPNWDEFEGPPEGFDGAG